MKDTHYAPVIGSLLPLSVEDYILKQEKTNITEYAKR